jgi:Bifunctional DNA primase/polymerase, N-terminal/Family of unknown function (DUF5906)
VTLHDNSNTIFHEARYNGNAFARGGDPNTRTVETALAYHRRGWQPVPLEGKKPRIRAWQNTRYTEAELPGAFKSCNIGVRLGLPSGGLADVDLDSPEARAHASTFLPPTQAVFGRESAPRSHRLYTVEPRDFKTLRLADPEAEQGAAGGHKGAVIELRGTGGQTMMPPSIHPSGEPVVWEGTFDSIQPAAIEYNVLLAAVQKTAAASALSRRWSKIPRHDAAMALAGALRQMGFSADVAIQFIVAVAEVGGDDEIEDRQRAVEDTNKKFDAAEPIAGAAKCLELFGTKAWKTVAKWLGLRTENGADAAGYLVQKAKLEEEFCIIEATREIYDRVNNKPISPYNFTHVAASTFNYTDSISGKTHSAAERWLRDPARLTFKRIVCDPGSTPEGCLNKFKGFTVEPVQGDTSWWDGPDGLLAYVIHDATVRREIECILGRPFHEPKQWKVIPCPVLIGAGGIGKDQIGEAICGLLPEAFVARVTAHDLESQYDGFLKEALFCKVEEGRVSSRAAVERQKKRISSKTNLANEKYGRLEKTQNLTNWYFSTNDTAPIPIQSVSERRLLIYKSPAEPMPREMAAHVADRLRDPVALAALLYRFQHEIDYSGFDPFAPAMKTSDFYELVNEQSPSDIDRWVERLIDGIPDDLELLRSDIWEMSMLAKRLPDEMRRQKGHETALQHSMSSDRFRDQIACLGQTRLAPLAPKQRVRLWAVRNGAEWKSKGINAARDEFIRAHTDAIKAKVPKFSHRYHQGEGVAELLNGNEAR